MPLPYLVFSDKKGNIYCHPHLRMAVAGGLLTLPREEELIKVPKGSAFFYLPGRLPIGYNPSTNKFEVVDSFKGKEVFALGVHLIPAYLRLYYPPYLTKTKITLPLWAYAACGYYGGKFFAAAKRVDKRTRQSPGFYNTREIVKGINIFLKKFPENKLINHLKTCALVYNCLAAKNFFLRRWEAPLPVSRTCNARCQGCLSYQEENCLASHSRIDFKVSLRELTEVMQEHLLFAKEPIVSFGQGCEGEPLLEAKLISSAIRDVREKTKKGTIHMNTNGSLPPNIELICQAGIDSFRFTLNSTREETYNYYFKPVNYTFSDVCKSIKIAKKYKKFVSINLLIFPGVSDKKEEIKSLLKFLKKYKIDMLQLRNLNIDPSNYCPGRTSRNNIAGIYNFVKIIKREFPQLRTGYFNIPQRGI